MTGYVKRRAKCPVCGDEFVVTAAGGMRMHNGHIYANGQPPVEKEESA